MQPEVQSSMARGGGWAALALPLIVARLWPGGRLLRVEDDAHGVCQSLDQTAGIDWIVEHRAQLFGLSVRCQRQQYLDLALDRYGAPTFTIRQERLGPTYTAGSEFAKAVDAARVGALSAAYQVHVYVDTAEQRVLAWAVARRGRLVRYVVEHLAEIPSFVATDHDRRQRQTFLVVPWHWLIPDILIAEYPSYAADAHAQLERAALVPAGDRR